MIDDLWALLRKLNRGPRSMVLENPTLYIVLSHLGYAKYDETFHTCKITQMGREALQGAGMEPKIFKQRDDGKYDLPDGMVAEAGGQICYIRRVDLDYFRSLTHLTSNYHEVLYLNVAETLSKSLELAVTRQIFTEAQAMGFETLAFYPLIEAGMMVYRNDQGEMYPSMVEAHSRPMGFADIHPDGSVTIIIQGSIGPEIQGGSGPGSKEDEDAQKSDS